MVASAVWRFNKEFYRGRGEGAPRFVVVDTNFLLGHVTVETACNDSRYMCYTVDDVKDEVKRFTGKVGSQVPVESVPEEVYRSSLEVVKRRCLVEWRRLDEADRKLLALAYTYNAIVASDDELVNSCASKLGLETVKSPPRRVPIV